ncbi:MAG: 7TM domain-containing protein [Patescibacteria group bacterium]
MTKINKFLLACFISLLFAGWGFNVLAEDPIITNPNEDATTALDEIIQTPTLQAEAGENKNVAVGRNVAFDASSSTIPPDKEISYTWNFGDEQTAVGIDTSHIYERAGQYVVTLTINDGDKESQDFTVVSVEQDIILLITDNTVSDATIENLNNYAHQHEVLLVKIENKKNQDNSYLTAQKIAQQLLTSPTDLQQANIVILWTANNTGLDALNEWARIVKAATAEKTDAVAETSWKQKAIINISDNKTGTARLAQNTYNQLSPKYILLTTESTIQTIIDNPSPDKIIPSLNNNGLSYQMISEHSQRSLEKITPLNFMSYLLNFLINKGVSQNTIFLLLILPVIATIISFARQIIGVKAFGIYVPSIIALAFLETDLKWGLFIFLTLLIVGTLTRVLARKLRILYMPRMAIVLSVASLSIFALFVVGSYFNKTGLLIISIFPIIVMIILTEKFIEVQIEKGNQQAIRLTIETLILSIISYYIVSWETFRTIILAYPELVLLTLILNLLFGRFTGLRIVEYFRFRKILKNANSV